MSEDNIRESQRANKGIPPVRFGFEKVQQSSTPSAGARWPTLNLQTAHEFIPSLRTSGEGILPDNPGVVNNTDGLEGASKVSNAGRRSKTVSVVSSVASDVQRIRSSLKFDEEMDATREELASVQLQKLNLEAELQEEEERLQSKLDSLTAQALTVAPEGLSEVNKEIDDVNNEITRFRRRRNLSIVEKDNKLDSLARKVSRLSQAKKLAEREIDLAEENNSYYMDSDEEIENNAAWEKRQQNSHIVFEKIDEHSNNGELEQLEKAQLENEKRKQELADLEEEFTRKRDAITNRAQVEQIQTRQSSPEILELNQHPIAETLVAQNQTMAMQSQALHAIIAKLSEPKRDTQSDSSKYMARQAFAKELPFFNGRPEDWPQFVSDYRRTTVACGFDDADNLTRLRKCLKGDAEKAVKMLMISENNVSKIMDILETRFGNPEYIINNMIEKAREVSAVKEDKPESVIEFGTAVSNMVTLIETLKCNEHLCNPSLLRELEAKLPTGFRSKWADWLVNNKEFKRNLPTFNNWLMTQVEAALILCPPKFTSYYSKEEKVEVKRFDNRRGDNRKNNDRRDNRRVGVHAINEGQQPKVERKPFCDICTNPGHWVSDCRKFKGKSVRDRWEVVKEKRLCYCCLGSGHNVSGCDQKKECSEVGCDKPHHKLLHRVPYAEKAKEPKQAAEPAAQAAPVVRGVNVIGDPVQVMATDSKGNRTLMGILPVALKEQEKIVLDFAFLDKGSYTCLAEDSLRVDLSVEGKEEPFCMSTMNGVTTYEKSQRISVDISGTFPGAKTYRLEDVRTVDKLPLQVSSQDMQELRKQWPHLRNLPIASFKNIKPRLLIGSCHGCLINPLELKESKDIMHAPWGAKSRLGWYLGGTTSKDVSKGIPTYYNYHICEPNPADDYLHQLVKKSFCTEDFGVKVVVEKVRSKEDERAMTILETTTNRVEGTDRFQTGLLWKQDDTKLPESYTTCLHRLVCQERKMDKNPEFGVKYCAKMKEYEEKGFISKLTTEQAAVKSDKLWYLPHFGVVNPMKPDKLRLVFDAAAKSRGISLNDALVQGPDFMNPLISVLWKFRTNKIAFTGDIKDMFHRVLIRDEDRPAQRFLWRGMKRNCDPDVYQMNVMVFGATCSPSAAQYVKNLNASEFKDEYPDAHQAILTKIYVDDYLDSKPSEAEAIKIIQDVISVNAKGGFQVCNWLSNSKEVMEAIPKELRAAGMQNLELDRSENPINRVLGLYWDTDEDILTFVKNYHRVPKEIVDGTRRPTKREILKLVMSVFDPPGVVAHLTIKPKIIQQDVWRSGIGWDDSITDDLNIRWKSWIRELDGIEQVKIPRCYSVNIPHADLIQLHLFCDASEKAFASVAFLVVKYGEHRDCAFVSAKTRVAPLKPLTIPKLELQGALMASRLANTLKEEMEVNIDEKHFWCDSTTALYWIRSDARRYKQFVANRVGEILETTEVSDWHWVPTKLNVADDATRDSEPSDLSPTSRWFLGEDFIKQDKEFWPKEKTLPEPNPDDMELKCETIPVFTTLDGANCLPNINKFSSWLKLIRSTAFVIRFVNIVKAKWKNEPTVIDTELSVYELNRAEKEWWKVVQRECFAEELKLLNGGKPLQKTRLRKLTPFLDKDGIIRSRGRIAAAPDVNDDTKHPVILDPKHPFTQRLVLHYHVRAGHKGRELVANELRQKYWVLDISAAIKKVWAKCNMCKVMKAAPSVPMMGDLPVERLTAFTRPFQHTGMDYFGPMEVTVGRRHEKRYGVLFTCFVTRAVHLEIAASLDTDSAIMAIRRMICRRGQPKVIQSDNGTNLRGADAELKRALQALDQLKIQQELSPKGIDWRFIPPAAPHMGGIWERLVGSVKRAIKGTLLERAPREEVLHTLFAEAENMVNSRPLTDVSVDVDDPTSLTPNHFLMGWSNGLTHNNNQTSQMAAPVPGIFDDDDLVLRKKWRASQRLADHFWQRWINEYLPTLNKRNKWNKDVTNVKIDDVVLILDDQRTRNHWLKGIIEEVFPGDDGQVRVVKVRTTVGTYRRPVSKICVLEILDVSDEENKFLHRGEECGGMEHPEQPETV